MSDDENGRADQNASWAPPGGEDSSAGPVDEPAGPTGPTEPDGTGDTRVDEALRRLPELDSTDVADHEEIYSDIHQRLAAVLDDGPGSPTPEH